MESRISSVLVEPVAALQKIPTYEEKENSLLRRVHAYAHLLETSVLCICSKPMEHYS